MQIGCRSRFQFPNYFLPPSLIISLPLSLPTLLSLIHCYAHPSVSPLPVVLYAGCTVHAFFLLPFPEVSVLNII